MKRIKMKITKPEPILVVDRFPNLLNSLLDLLNNLSIEEWGYPATVEGWTVKDVALHLLGDDVGFLSSRRDSFSGSYVSVSEWDDLVSWINKNNAEWVNANRRMSPRVLCDLLRFTGNQINEFFVTMDPYATGVPISWAGPDPALQWMDLAREFTERWHHQQHIREAVRKPGVMEPYYLRPVLATFVFGLPRAYQAVDAKEGTWVTLTITGRSGGTWTIQREQETWKLYSGRPEKPMAVVVLPEETAWRVFTKGISKNEARKQAILSGNEALAEKVLETISIIA